MKYKRIAVVGTYGIGKTTMVDLIAKRSTHPIIPEGTREILEFSPDESWQRVRDGALASISQWNPEALGTHVIKAREGKLRTIRWHSAPLSENYAPAGIAAIGEDITSALCAEKYCRKTEDRISLSCFVNHKEMNKILIRTGATPKKRNKSGV